MIVATSMKHEVSCEKVQVCIYSPKSNATVRIEDDILVSKNGNEILTINVPKEIAEIEEIVGSGILI